MRKKMSRHKDNDLKEWFDIVSPILNSDEYQRRKSFRHHGDVTVYEHSVKVSKYAFSVAKKLHLNKKDAAIAGLLHDFYETPWQDVTIKQPFFKMHGFTHAQNALENSQKYYSAYLNPVIENAIQRHMFPLNIRPPKYKVGVIITIVDKYASLDMLTSKEALKKTFAALKGQ
jgi:uncharacterized protein